MVGPTNNGASPPSLRSRGIARRFLVAARWHWRGSAALNTYRYHRGMLRGITGIHKREISIIVLVYLSSLWAATRLAQLRGASLHGGGGNTGQKNMVVDGTTSC